MVMDQYLLIVLIDGGKINNLQVFTNKFSDIYPLVQIIQCSLLITFYV